MSFRESFASVNGVLSAIAGKTIGGSFVDSARGCTDIDGHGGNSEFAVGKQNLKVSSSSTGEAVGSGGAGGLSLPASPDHASLPPPTPLRRVQQSIETASGSGGGLLETAFRLTPGGSGGAGAGLAAAACGVTGEFGGLAGEEEQMPAEMSGMLQRYSEMMLKVVQVRHT